MRFVVEFKFLNSHLLVFVSCLKQSLLWILCLLGRMLTPDARACFDHDLEVTENSRVKNKNNEDCPALEFDRNFTHISIVVVVF